MKRFLERHDIYIDFFLVMVEEDNDDSWFSEEYLMNSPWER